MSRNLNLVFPGYEEGAITFKPTYKYDNGTDVYDSSEKQRVPSWTGKRGKLEDYPKKAHAFSLQTALSSKAKT